MKNIIPNFPSVIEGLLNKKTTKSVLRLLCDPPPSFVGGESLPLGEKDLFRTFGEKAIFK